MFQTTDDSLGDEDFLALRLGEILFGMKLEGVSLDVVRAALDERPKLREAAKVVRQTVRAQDMVKTGSRVTSEERS